MKGAGYWVLMAIAGCSRGMCHPSGGAAPTTAPSAPRPPEAAAAAEADGSVLREVLEELRKGGRTRVAEPPDEAEGAAYRAWVAAAARAAAAAQPPPADAPPGFSLQRLPDRAVWVLAEDATRRRGAGAVALRVGPAAPLIIEAPHTFFDQGTLPIALAIFLDQRARALLINTSHRYGGQPPPRSAGPDGASDVDEDGPAAETDAATITPPPTGSALAFADVAHAERSFFLAAHQALLESAPGLPTVQLHGFQDSSAPRTDGIVSGVGRGAALDRLLASMRRALPDSKLLAYPSEIRKLGGETNVQARASRAADAPFYHVELSRTLRDGLLGDPELLRRFSASFADIAFFAAEGLGKAASPPLPTAP